MIDHIINVGHGDLYFIRHKDKFYLKSESINSTTLAMYNYLLTLLHVLKSVSWLNLMSRYNAMIEIMINVGHSNLYFTVLWFYCLYAPFKSKILPACILLH